MRRRSPVKADPRTLPNRIPGSHTLTKISLDRSPRLLGRVRLQSGWRRNGAAPVAGVEAPVFPGGQGDATATESSKPRGDSVLLRRNCAVVRLSGLPLQQVPRTWP